MFCYFQGGCVAPYSRGRHLFILTCIGGRCPGDSEYSTQTLTHGPQQEVDGGNTPLEQPTHGLGELGRRAGGGRWVSEAIWGSVWLSGAPRETELHCQRRTQIERKQERQRLEGSRLGRERDGWMEKEGWGSTETRGGISGKSDRKSERQKKRGTVSSVCVHTNIWTSELSFSSANHHRVKR